MSVKASISLTEAQEAFARELVRSRRFSSLSAVLRRGLEMVRRETEAHAAEVKTLRNLLQERREGRFVDVEVGRATTRQMLKAKRAAHGDI
jgi:antitoxin ParD1/3/4